MRFWIYFVQISSFPFYTPFLKIPLHLLNLKTSIFSMSQVLDFLSSSASLKGYTWKIEQKMTKSASNILFDSNMSSLKHTGFIRYTKPITVTTDLSRTRWIHIVFISIISNLKCKITQTSLWQHFIHQKHICPNYPWGKICVKEQFASISSHYVHKWCLQRASAIKDKGRKARCRRFWVQSLNKAQSVNKGPE